VVRYNPQLDYIKDFPFDSPSLIYSEMDKVLLDLGLDKKNYGTENWNPFGILVPKKGKVVIKPNFVSIKNHHIALNRDRLNGVTTHPSILRPLIDYAFKAVGKKGKISIVDSPIEAADFEETVEALNISHMVNYLKTEREYPLELIDLRDFRVVPKMFINSLNIGERSLNIGFFKKLDLTGDPRGYTIVDLKKDSEYSLLNDEKLDRLRFYKPHFKEPTKHHDKIKNEYSIPNTVLEADFIVNVPKLKTHKKAGVTLAMKNLIGLINRKNWLPHYTEGVAPKGDQYPKRPSFVEKFEHLLSVVPVSNKNSIIIRFPKVDHKTGAVRVPIRDGNWSGNDTLWRAILDICRIILYADEQGVIRDTQQRKILSIVDGVVAGEGEGPIGAMPKKCGILIGSFDMVAADVIATKIMGFDPKRLLSIQKAPEHDKYPLGTSDISKIEVIPQKMINLNLRFKPPKGWRTYIYGECNKLTGKR